MLSLNKSAYMKNSFLLLSLILPLRISAQETIAVAESTFKIKGLGDEEFYYGFAEGDQLIFNFYEVDGKELKEVEIIELPGSSKFMDYETKKIENKRIEIISTGIYKFRFRNAAMGGRICKFKIERVPINDATKNFNTSVYWKTVYDTTIVPTQERFLVSSDTMASNLVDQVAKISSTNAINGNPNKNVVDFTLPEGTVSWSYYIGVGNEGKEAFTAARTKFLNSASATVSSMPGYGPMAALALSGINYFASVQGDDNVKYWFIPDWDNVQLFKANQSFQQFKLGDVINDASKMTKPLTGKVYLGLMNDNTIEPIDVSVKITAIVVIEKWDTRMVSKMNIASQKMAYLRN